jgi:dihydrofolate reductase
MRKVVVTEFLSLDGVIEAPDQWQGPFFNDEMSKYKLDELRASDALLLGRVTYQIFADYWPFETDEEGFAERMNGLPKYVVATTLDKAEWNNSTLIKENAADEISKLKQQDGQDIVVYGSAGLIQTLMQHDLVDEYRLMIHPVVVGHGKRLFQDGIDTKVLKLVDTQTFDTGAMVLTFQPADNEE